jgi:Fe2+ transport system protein FeoA
MMNLTQAPLKKELLIRDILPAKPGFEAVVIRMQELGIMPEQKMILLERAGIFGKTYLIQTNGLKLALSSVEAQYIELVEMT